MRKPKVGDVCFLYWNMTDVVSSWSELKPIAEAEGLDGKLTHFYFIEITM